MLRYGVSWEDVSRKEDREYLPGWKPCARITVLSRTNWLLLSNRGSARKRARGVLCGRHEAPTRRARLYSAAPIPTLDLLRQ